MCGIVGYQGAGDITSLRAALAAIAHRGPDDHGVFVDDAAGVGLAHARLSILDLSPRGHQPMLSEDGRVTLIFNGEIYNFRELKAELQNLGYHFRSESDTEVVLNLYLHLGTSLLSRLNGIFAMALWDRRDGVLFIARDGLGVKPLYYGQIAGAFVFASELKALLPLIPGETELDAMALHRYLSFLWCPGDGTPFKAVRKLLPGEAMTVRDGCIVSRWTWYELPPLRGVTPDLSEHAAIAGTAQGLRRAVRRQLVADVPVGAFLSGGLDSSAIVAFAREQVPDIRCFTIESVGGTDEGVVDDLPYAREAARHLGVSLDVVRVEAASMAAELEWMVGQLDEPLADPAPLNVYHISRLARDNGIKVMLSGAGGDDLFTGYRRHAAVRYERFWDWLPHSARVRLRNATAGLRQDRPALRRLSKLFAVADFDGDERLAAYFAWVRESELYSLYTPRVRAQVTEAAAQPMLDFLRPMPSRAPLDRMLALEQRFFLADHNLLYTDKMSMAAGVEVRVPYLDADLVEHAAKIPLAMKQRGRVGKWVLKKAMEPYLPRSVIYRPKTGFGAPLRRWLRNDLRHVVDDTLSADALNRRGVFDPAGVRRLLELDRQGRIDASYTIFSLVGIELWCRRFIDANRATALAPAAAASSS